MQGTSSECNLWNEICANRTMQSNKDDKSQAGEYSPWRAETFCGWEHGIISRIHTDRGIRFYYSCFLSYMSENLKVCQINLQHAKCCSLRRAKKNWSNWPNNLHLKWIKNWQVLEVTLSDYRYLEFSLLIEAKLLSNILWEAERLKGDFLQVWENQMKLESWMCTCKYTILENRSHKCEEDN